MSNIIKNKSLLTKCLLTKCLLTKCLLTKCLLLLPIFFIMCSGCTTFNEEQYINKIKKDIMFLHDVSPEVKISTLSSVNCDAKTFTMNVYDDTEKLVIAAIQKTQLDNSLSKEQKEVQYKACSELLQLMQEIIND